MRVALGQFKSRAIGSFDEFADHVRWHIDGARWQEADIIVFPEYFTSELLTALPEAKGVKSGDFSPVMERYASEFTEAYRSMLREFARESNIHIVAGSHFYLDESDGKYYNSSLFVDPSGRIEEQRKTHRAYELVYNRAAMTPGDDLRVFDTPWCRMGITICYDSAFPEVGRVLALQGAELLMLPSCVFNEYGVTRLNAYATSRAIENQCFVANSQLAGELTVPEDKPIVYRGQSAIHTPADPAFGARDGIAVQTTADLEQVVSADLDRGALRDYRKNAVPNMLPDRRPELYGPLVEAIK